jgi:integrase/recombinase XerD
VKSFLTYGHKLGYLPFNAGVTIKVRSASANRGAGLAKRIISEVEVSLLIRAARSKRDRVLLEVVYAGGLRVSEIVALTWPTCCPVTTGCSSRSSARAARCAKYCCPTSSAAPCCRCAAMPAPTTLCSQAASSAASVAATSRSAVNAMVKRAAAKAGLPSGVSPHWLRHAHGSHAIDKDASARRKGRKVCPTGAPRSVHAGNCARITVRQTARNEVATLTILAALPRLCNRRGSRVCP